MSPTAVKNDVRSDLRRCQAELQQARENLAFWKRQSEIRSNPISREAAKSMVEFSRGKVDGQSMRLRTIKSLLK